LPQLQLQERSALMRGQEQTISPSGDPFHAAPEDQDHPHACLKGYIYLSYTAFDEQTGEEVERIEALPCRRCAEEVR
jgi:hypothetical protein